MNYYNTIEVLKNDLKEIDEIVEGFLNQEKIPQIDVDLALNKMRSIYDLLIFIKKTNEDQIGAEFENESSKPVQKTENIEQKMEDEKKQEEIMAEKEEQAEKTELETRPENNDLEKNQKQIEKEVLGEKYVGRNASINESISQNRLKKDVISKMQSKPLDNINHAIGINDRFLYQKELFNNDKEQYKSAIDRVNSAESYEQAMDYLNSNFKWDEESATTQKFLELVKRKFLNLNI